ncbi:MAG: hypothetical protein DSM106950_19670 [Stigonema ocellatum SAG 48.90 = DSM 106950]|nr:hypothetical protein [Stigonema ocellatum SAG 48.90 = DSM 106950]
MRNLVGTLLVVSQMLILVPSHAQTVREAEKKTNNTVSISSEAIPSMNTTLPAKSSNSHSSSDQTKVIAADSISSVSSVVTKPSARIPISSRIFDHPTMQQ